MKSNNFRVKALAAFTVVELVVVMGIMAILGAIVVPNTISMMRSSRIESADTLAYELYTAVQNYLTDQQIKNKPLYCDSSINNSNESCVFPVDKPSGNKIIFGVVGVNTYYTGSGYTGISSAVTNADQKKADVVNGIRRYLGSGIDNGTNDTLKFWAVQVDINTYTVDWVLCSEQPTAQVDVTKVVQHYNSSKKLYQSKFDVDAHSADGWTSQEYDTNHRTDGTHVGYVGQYPIPYPG